MVSVGLASPVLIGLLTLGAAGALESRFKLSTTAADSFGTPSLEVMLYAFAPSDNVIP